MDVRPPFRRDGKHLVLQRGDPFTAMEVLIAPFVTTSDHPELGKPELLLRARGFPMPAFSPDGDWIAYASRERERPEVYVQPFQGAGERVAVSTEGGGFPVFSSNGHELFFLGADRRIMVADYTAHDHSFSPGKPRVWSRQQILMNDSGGPFQPYALAPDGKRFIGLIPSDQLQSGAPAAPQIQVVLNWFEDLKRRVPVH